MQERRKNLRRLPESDLYLIDLQSDQPLGVIRDLTVDGCKLSGSAPVKLGQAVHCRLALPEAVLGCSELNMMAETRWCTAGDMANTFEIGLQFHGLSDKEQMIIKMLTVPWEESEPLRQTPSQQAADKK